MAVLRVWSASERCRGPGIFPKGQSTCLGEFVTWQTHHDYQDNLKLDGLLVTRTVPSNVCRKLFNFLVKYFSIELRFRLPSHARVRKAQQKCQVSPYSKPLE
jgi:hypothetical protein